MIEYRETKSHNGLQPNLVRCPVCDYEFKSGLSRSKHIAEHDPEDFGL